MSTSKVEHRGARQSVAMPSKMGQGEQVRKHQQHLHRPSISSGAGLGKRSSCSVTATCGLLLTAANSGPSANAAVVLCYSGFGTFVLLLSCISIAAVAFALLVACRCFAAACGLRLTAVQRTRTS